MIVELPSQIVVPKEPNVGVEETDKTPTVMFAQVPAVKQDPSPRQK